MARLPTRTQSRRLLSSLSLALFALTAVVCFTAPAVKAEEAHSEYGTVIGIGEWQPAWQRCNATNSAMQIWEQRMNIFSIELGVGD